MGVGGQIKERVMGICRGLQAGSDWPLNRSEIELKLESKTTHCFPSWRGGGGLYQAAKTRQDSRSCKCIDENYGVVFGSSSC